MVNRYDISDSSLQESFWFWPFFDLFTNKMDQKMTGAKNVVDIKNQFFMPINHV